ncbi:MAG: family 16 glycoside hydrolase [Planctomycetota bacterium]
MAERGQRVLVDAEGGKQVVGRVGFRQATSAAEWNTYTIIAAGDRVLHLVNGVPTVDVTDLSPTRMRKGWLGLQLHAGPEMTAEFRRVEIEVLQTDAALARLDQALREAPEPPQLEALNVPPTPEWIWAEGDPADIWVRHRFELPAGARDVRLDASCDNQMTLFLDGQEIGSGDDWASPQRLSLTGMLQAGGAHELTVKCHNEGGPAAFFARLVWTDGQGKVTAHVTGEAGWEVHPRGLADVRMLKEGWQAAKKLGALGCAPWNSLDQDNWWTGEEVQSNGLWVRSGFEVDLLHRTQRSTEGSWVSLANDGHGRLIVSDQGGFGLQRITLQGDTAQVEPLGVPVPGCQGLLVRDDVLYANTGAHGLMRLGYDAASDTWRLLDAGNGAKGEGEHGNHAVLADPANGGVYVIAGNHVNVPERLHHGDATHRWGEDLLLPRQWDANGHAKGRLAPGGWIAKVDGNGRGYRIESFGYRNVYDGAFNEWGDLIVYDADMEWDMGLPWYRPTRFCLASRGSDYGWRSGSGKWPEWYEDSLPALVEVGPGSPTGVVAGTDTRFPAEYQRAIFALDWTFGTIYALHLEAKGAGYAARLEPFVTGAPLPVTDAVVGEDGALYFVTGGRGTQGGLYRVRYTGGEATDKAPLRSAPEGIALRHRLEAQHGSEDAGGLEVAWPYLDSPDRFLRAAARVAVESRPVGLWARRALQETRPQARITAAVALARQGEPQYREALLAQLLSWPLAQMDREQRLGALRAFGLCFLRLGPPSPSERAQVAAHVGGLTGKLSVEERTEVLRLLVYLDAPDAIERGLAWMRNPEPAPQPAWGELITRNADYGGPIARWLADPGPAAEIGYAFFLRNLRYGWSLEQRREYLEFLASARRHPGGNSYTGFLDNLRNEALANMSAAERAALGDLAGANPPVELGFQVTPPKGPARAWTLAQAAAVFEDPAALTGRDFESGRNLFHAVACAACHRFDGMGGAIGPDLTTVRNKFATSDLLESILEPSRVISDQYVASKVTRKDGSQVSGLLVEHPSHLDVYPAAASAEPIVIPRDQVARVERLPISPMPPGLVNALGEEELKDLLAYLLSRGNPKDPMFR